MIWFIAYAFVLFSLIYFWGFFGLFNDEQVRRKKMALLFAGKALAVPVFYLLYQKLYGGIEKFDTGKFFQDVQVLSDCSREDAGFFLRLMFGLQNDSEGSNDFVKCLANTQNWDNGTVKDYLYNDNRVVIRTHLLLDFISPRQFLVHALLNCFLSFTGIFFIYRSIKHLFMGKEMMVLIILCFFPALWFYTGAVLKEGLCLFVMGLSLHCVRRIISRNRTAATFIGLVVLIYISSHLKPYLLLSALFFFSLYFYLEQKGSFKRKVLFYLLACVTIIVLGNVASIFLKDRSLYQAALEHQQRFEAVSNGGIFLSHQGNYLQLPPDTSLVKKVDEEHYTIRPGAAYMYWKPGKPRDTLYCSANTDTSTVYYLKYIIPKSGSNIELNKNNAASLFGSALYYSFLQPFFWNARNALQWLASIENLALLLGLIILIWGFIKRKKPVLFPLACVCFAFSISLLTGITAPNSGAIFRYRAEADVFLLLAALYFLDLRGREFNLFKTSHKPATSNK